MAISEKIALLGKGLYKDIPDVLTLKAIPTATELDYVGGDDFQKTMLDVIFPQAIEEKCNFRDLLQIDFDWVCRGLRILNYGPYYTTNAIFCPDCDQVSRGEYQVDLMNVDVKMLPEGFTNKIVISKNEFLDFDQDITLSLPTIQDFMNAEKDQLFVDKNGDTDIKLAKLCYMIKAIGANNKLTPLQTMGIIKNKMSAADYQILKELAKNLTDYGLRAGGSTGCPKCNSRNAMFMALVDDRFFRPTMGDLRTWKANRNAQRSSQPTDGISQGGFGNEIIPGNATTKV